MTRPLPVPGERYKLHEFTREVVKVEPGVSYSGRGPNRVASPTHVVTFQIQLGSKAETHVVSLSTWERWAEKATKESAC